MGFSYLNGIWRSSAKRFPLAAEPGQLRSSPVFIIGAGRSGTTLLRSMLVASGQIAIPAETQIIHRLAILFNTSRSLGWEDQARLVIAAFESHRFFPLWQVDLAEVYPKVLALPKQERSLARIIDEVYTSYAAQAFPRAKVWGDQSPLHTFYLPYIHRIFPQARYIHMLRDGRDVTASLVSRYGDGHLFESVLRWKTSLKRVKQLQGIISPDQFIEIRYEALVRQPELTLSQVCKFIGIDYSPSMLDYWKLPSTIEHKHYSYHKNLEKPVFDSSIGKWKEVLNLSQQQYVHKEIRRELQQLGYLEQ
jgi:hypothetical protein